MSSSRQEFLHLVRSTLLKRSLCDRPADDGRRHGSQETNDAEDPANA